MGVRSASRDNPLGRSCIPLGDGCRRANSPSGDWLARSGGLLRRSHRTAGRLGQCRGGSGLRSGQGCGPRSRQRRRACGTAARRAGHGQGGLPRRGLAHDLRLPGTGRQHAGLGRGLRGPVQGRRRRPARQDQHGLCRRRLPDLQRGVRHDQQPVGSRPHSRRLLRWLVGGIGGRTDAPRGGFRHRRIDSESRPLLRRLRTQADLRHRLADRPLDHALPGPGHGSRGLRPHGA